MERFLTRFWSEEDGNTTIDWMVLTAGLIMLGVAVMAAVGTTSQSLADDTSAVINQVNTGV
jgi:Flp pilus assembly pilin Flp